VACPSFIWTPPTSLLLASKFTFTQLLYHLRADAIFMSLLQYGVMASAE